MLGKIIERNFFYLWYYFKIYFLFFFLKFVVLPTAIVICCTLSSMLTVIVILGRFFSSPVRFQDILHVDGSNEDNIDGIDFLIKIKFKNKGNASTSGGGYNGGGIRKRTTSVSSCHSCGSLKFSCDELPKPMCRVCFIIFF
jgi:hypothetical protein